MLNYLRGEWAQWKFPAKAGATLAFMSFRSAVREEDSKEAGFDRFSLFGFHLPLPLHWQFRFNSQVSWQQYAMVAHDHHHEQGLDSYGVAEARHPQGGSRMAQPSVSPHHPVPFNQANPILQV
ncbi:hypothetical protein ABZP36_029625 [Zizania latifolia]